MRVLFGFVWHFYSITILAKSQQARKEGKVCDGKTLFENGWWRQTNFMDHTVPCAVFARYFGNYLLFFLTYGTITDVR